MDCDDVMRQMFVNLNLCVEQEAAGALVVSALPATCLHTDL